MRYQLFALLGLALCVEVSAADEPQWLKDARGREAKDLKETTIKSTDGLFTARILGSVKEKIEGKDGDYPFLIDLGTDTPMSCEVLKDGFDAASLLRATAEVTFKDLEPIQGRIEKRGVEHSDAGAFDSRPYLAVDWIYRVSTDKGPQLGQLKQIAIRVGDHGLYCAHVELGYSKTFFSVVKTFSESIRFPGDAAAPYYSEVSTMEMGGSRIGYEWVTMERDADGDTKVVATSSLAMRVTPETLRSQDAVHIQFVHPDGAFINGVHVVTTDGEMESNLNLKPADDGTWHVQGTFKGKTLDQDLQSGINPTSWLQMAQDRRKAFAKPDSAGTKLSSPMWVISDPTRLIESQTTLGAASGPNRISATESIGELKAQYVLDKATGYPVSATVDIGPVSLRMERVYQQGSF